MQNVHERLKINTIKKQIRLDKRMMKNLKKFSCL
jgi:hypothetical protein